MRYELRRLRDLIDEIERLDSDLEYMVKAWEGDDPCEAACSDPGLQFAKGEELQEAYEELKELCSTIIEDN